MALPSSPNQISLKDILDEKQGSTTARTNVSLKGLSVNGTNDYQGVDITGTPNGTAPYSVSEFHGWSNVTFTFNMRGSNSAEPSYAISAKGTGEIFDNSSAQQQGTASALFYPYYRSNGNIAITAIPTIVYNSAFDSYRKWANNSGTLTTLADNGNTGVPEPGIEFGPVASGYTVRVEVDKNEGPGSLGSNTFTVAGVGLGSFTQSGDTYTHSGTAALPTQTSTQNTNGQYPTNIRAQATTSAVTVPANNIYSSKGDYNPAFRFIFEKSGQPTYTIYLKADIIAVANNIF